MNTIQSANIIKKLCKDRGIPISSMLSHCNIRLSLIYDMEKRSCIPSGAVLEKMADYLDCSIDYLLGRTDIPEVNRGEIYDEEVRLVAAPKITPAEITFDDDKPSITK